MASIQKRTLGSDRKRVAPAREVTYEAHKIGTSQQEVRKVVKEVGSSRGKDEDRLSKDH